MENSCRSLDLFAKARAKISIHFMPPAATGRRNFSVLQRTKTISQTARASRFGRIRARKWIAWLNWSAKVVAKRLKGRKSVSITVLATDAFFFEDPDGNKLEICCREKPIIAE